MHELTAILNDIRPGQDFSKAKNFFDQGMLDSLDLTTLVSALEARFGVFIDVDEMVVENFCSLSAIESILTRKGIKV
jgi:acyl carrier protein